MCLLFPCLCREAAGTAKMLYFPHSEWRDRYIIILYLLAISIVFPKCIFLEFPFCLFQIVLYPQTKKNFSCDRCALWMVRNRLTAWFRMPHLWHGELHWIKKSLIDIVSSLWRPQKIRLYYNSSISMLNFFRFYGKILPFRILQLCAKEKTVKCATTAE